MEKKTHLGNHKTVNKSKKMGFPDRGRIIEFGPKGRAAGLNYLVAGF